LFFQNQGKHTMSRMTTIWISLEHGFGEDLLIRNVWAAIGRGRRQEILRHALVLGLHEMAKSGRLPSSVSRIFAESSDNMAGPPQAHNGPPDTKSPSLTELPEIGAPELRKPEASMPETSIPETRRPEVRPLEIRQPETGMPAQAGTGAEATKEVAAKDMAKDMAQETPRREANGFVPSKKLGRLM